MARGVNKVILLGNVGSDPDVRSFPSGDQVTTIRLATSEAWKDKQTGEPQERTEWHRVVFTGKLAEIASSYIQKGSKVYVEGSIRSRSYQKNGVDVWTTEIRATSLELLDSGSGNRGQSRAENASGQRASDGFGDSSFGDGCFDDDIPF